MQSTNTIIMILLFLFLNTLSLMAEKENQYYNPYINIINNQSTKEMLPQYIPKFNGGRIRIKEPRKRTISNQDIIKSQNIINKAFQGFFARGIYLNGAIGHETSSTMNIINSQNRDFSIKKDFIFLPSGITISKPFIFSGGIGYRVFNTSYLRGFRIEGQYYYSIFNNEEKYNQYLVFYSGIPLNNVVSKKQVSQKVISIGAMLYYDIFLFEDSYLFVPYIGVGYHKSKINFKQETTYANRENYGILTLENKVMQVNLKTQDISASIGVSLFNGYVYGEYISTKQIEGNDAKIANIKIGVRLPL